MSEDAEAEQIAADHAAGHAAGTAKALAREARKIERIRVLDLDGRWILAATALLGAFGLSGANLVINNSAELPTWASTGVGLVLGFYFGSKASGHGG